MTNTLPNKLPQDGAQLFLIWGDWLSCDPLRGSHDSQSPQYMGWLATLSSDRDTFSYPRDDISDLKSGFTNRNKIIETL